MTSNLILLWCDGCYGYVTLDYGETEKAKGCCQITLINYVMGDYFRKRR